MSNWQMKSYCPECGAVIERDSDGCCPSCGKQRGVAIETITGWAYWPVAPHRRVRAGWFRWRWERKTNTPANG